MNTEELLRGKRILVVDDEEDILWSVALTLSMCQVEIASSFEDGRRLLETRFYHVAVLDIMGVEGYELLRIATMKNIPALMLTAHALSKQDLKKSFEKGASYYVPKEQIEKLDIFLVDILDAKEKKRNVALKWYERLGPYCNKRFGSDWKDDDPKFWDSLLKD